MATLAPADDAWPRPCPFCEIVAGRGEVSLVAQDARVMAFLSLRQPDLGHTLVIPRRHVPTLDQLDAEDAAAMMQMAVRVSQAVRAALAQAGQSLWLSSGAAAGQEIDHVHLHVMARHAGDGLLRVYPGRAPQEPPRSTLDAMAARLAAAMPQ